MQLEQRLEMYKPVQRQQVYFVVGDLERLSVSVLYSGDNPKISSDGKGVFIPIKIDGVSIHDTYRIDSEGNISGGHSTINLPKEGKVYMPHGPGKPSIRSGSG